MTATLDGIARDLNSIGIREGDWVLVHSSLKSLGHVEGGAETAARAVCRAVGGEGLVIMPSLAATSLAGPEQPARIWNKHTTPSRVGAITEAFRTLEGTERSDHPTHALAAHGREAAVFVAGHPWSAPTLGIDSPYMKLVQQNAQIVFLGVSQSCNTTLHAFEQWLELPYMGACRVQIEEGDGTVCTVDITGYPLGCRGFYGRQKTRVQEYVEQSGIVRYGTVAAADVMIVPARDLAAVMFDRLYEEPDFLLCLKPECEFCGTGRRLIEAQREVIRSRFDVIADRGLYTPREQPSEA